MIEKLNDSQNLAPYDAEAMQTLRALNRWMSFSERIDEKDRMLLDRLAIGDALKVAADAVGISYACAQKRVVRHVATLGVANVSQLSSVWRKVHRCSRLIADGTPTVLRYADRIGEIVSKTDAARAAG